MLNRGQERVSTRYGHRMPRELLELGYGEIVVAGNTDSEGAPDGE